ncbi:MAG: hypothetical protein NDI61_06075 [Bdellovibrionaceae bacterium]|nr:hypothetical protein [Pseudobdellovibrionaceae bacterium]
MKRLIHNRRTMTKVVLGTLLSVVAAFQACGPGQLTKSQYASTDGNALDNSNYMIGDGGMIGTDGAKTVAVSNSENVLSSLVSMAGIGVPSARTLQVYNRERTKIAESGKADSVNAPMWVAVTTLSGEVCWDLIIAEKALAQNQRRIFTQVDFATAPAQVSDTAKNDLIRRLARSAWARNETSDELTLIKSGMASITGTTPADTDRQMLFACTAVMASLDAHDQ